MSQHLPNKCTTEIFDMSQYPTLKKMGINSIEKVHKYTLRRQSDADVLKIYYKRPKGSFLSRTKKFTFVHRGGMPIEVRQSKAFDDMSKVNPQLALAIAELEKLDATRKEIVAQDPKDKFLSDLDHLESVMTKKLDEMRRQINELS